MTTPPLLALVVRPDADVQVSAGQGGGTAYHALKPDEIAFAQVNDPRTTVPKLRTTPLTCGNATWYALAVPKLQNRRSAARTTVPPTGLRPLVRRHPGDGGAARLGQ